MDKCANISEEIAKWVMKKPNVNGLCQNWSEPQTEIPFLIAVISLIIFCYADNPLIILSFSSNFLLTITVKDIAVLLQNSLW